ncbi:MAG: pseudouridine-5'-phosphate glycosidase [Phycisphaerales bacterium]|jgi:pseudouridine-5'-phosphate glycosidase
MPDHQHAPTPRTTIVRRVAGRAAVALETTLLAHGLPAGKGLPLAKELDAVIESHGARPATIGVLDGTPIVGMTKDELADFLGRQAVEKANTANLGPLIHQGATAATTVSATVSLAASAGIRVMATGGLGGVHHNMDHRLDISADLAALAQQPVAVVSSGVKAILDVASTRELLETLGVPVVGSKTETFPAFYLTDSESGVDATFENVDDIAAFARHHLASTGRGVLIVQPVPAEHAIEPHLWHHWLEEAQAATPAVQGRAATPAVLETLHRISDGKTLEANLALVRANADLAARIAVQMAG